MAPYDSAFCLPLNVPVYPRSTPSSASRTSSATPPLSNVFCTNAAITNGFAPPLGALHTPSTASASAVLASGCFAVADAPYAVLDALGTPGGVSLDGGSIVLTDNNLSFRPFPFPLSSVSAASPTDTASATSATASSSLAGSKIILRPTAMTSSVTGGRAKAFPLCLSRG